MDLGFSQTKEPPTKASSGGGEAITNSQGPGPPNPQSGGNVLEGVCRRAGRVQGVSTDAPRGQAPQLMAINFLAMGDQKAEQKGMVGFVTD